MGVRECVYSGWMCRIGASTTREYVYKGYVMTQDFTGTITPLPSVLHCSHVWYLNIRIGCSDHGTCMHIKCHTHTHTNNAQ